MRILVTLIAILALPCAAFCGEPQPYDEAAQDQQQQTPAQKEFAGLVDEYNTLVKQDRWAEAELVARQAKDLDKNNPVAIIMFEKARIGRQIGRRVGANIFTKQEDDPAQLGSALSSNHDTSIYHLKHVPARTAIPAIRDAVAKALSLQSKDDPERCTNMSLMLIPTTADDALVAICPREQAALVKAAVESCDVSRQYAVRVSISEMTSNGKHVGEVMKNTCLLVGRDGSVACKSPSGETLTLTLKVAGASDSTAAAGSAPPQPSCAVAEEEEVAEGGDCSSAECSQSQAKCTRGLTACAGTCTKGTCSTAACSKGTCCSGTCATGSCSKGSCCTGMSSKGTCNEGKCATSTCCAGTCLKNACAGTCTSAQCANGEMACKAALSNLTNGAACGAEDEATRICSGTRRCLQSNECAKSSTCACEKEDACASCCTGQCARCNAQSHQTIVGMESSDACINCQKQADGRTVISITNCQSVTINTAAPSADSDADVASSEVPEAKCTEEECSTLLLGPYSEGNTVSNSVPPAALQILGSTVVRDGAPLPYAPPPSRTPTMAGDELPRIWAPELSATGIDIDYAGPELTVKPAYPSTNPDECNWNGCPALGNAADRAGHRVDRARESSNVKAEPPALLSLPQRPDSASNSEGFMTMPKWQSELLKYYHGRGLSEIFNTQSAHEPVRPMRDRLVAEIPKPGHEESADQTHHRGLVVVDLPDRLRIFESSAPATNNPPAAAAPCCTDCREELRTFLEEMFRASDLVERVTQASHTDSVPAAADAARDLPSVRHSKIETSVVTYPLRDLVLLDDGGRPVFDTCTIIDHLQGAVAPDSWAHPSVSIQLDQKSVSLVIRQTPEVHAKIHAYLSYLRRLQVKQICDLIERLSTDDKAAAAKAVGRPGAPGVKVLTVPATAPESRR